MDVEGEGAAAISGADGTSNGNTSGVSGNGTVTHIPDHFHPYLPGKTFNYSEDTLMKNIVAVLGPYGCHRLVLGQGSRANSNERSKLMYPHKRWSWKCGSCSRDDRNKDDSALGCCGIKIRLLLVDNDPESDPYLEVKEFNIPPLSRHLRVSQQARAASESKVITNEDMLTPSKTALLENLGECRTKYHTVESILSRQYDGLVVSKSLAHRVMQKGRKKAFGEDDDESMMIFYNTGLSRKEVDDKYGLGGKFFTRTCSNTGRLLCWVEQLPLEVLNARAYAKNSIWVDCTHGSSQYMLKAGPPSVCCWGGHVAPVGFFQVPEEETEKCKEMLVLLELDIPRATLCSDGGSAFPGIAEDLGFYHIEDTFHNDKNGDKKATCLPKGKKDTFGTLKHNALYHVYFPSERLDNQFEKMIELVEGDDEGGDKKELRNWITRIEGGKKKRCATYTTQYISMSAKGAASRCESMMTILKAAGNLKGEMKKWTLPELQRRHEQVVQSYTYTAYEEIKEAIKKKEVFSKYVLDMEQKELKIVPELKIVSTTTNTSNPFHGILQSSQKTVHIRVHSTSVSQIGLDIAHEVVDSKHTLRVDHIMMNSIFYGTDLRVGMFIHTIDGETFETFEEGRNMIQASIADSPCTTILVDTVPSTGTVYTICSRDNKMQRTVFVPNKIEVGSDSGGHTTHCQSDFHVHTSCLIRCRFIQRALMESERSMKDDTTINSRWHIKNSPLYEIVHRDLVNLMEIDGLGDESLPSFLTSANVASSSGSMVAIGGDNANVQEDNTELDEEVSSREKVKVPSTQNKRYNGIMSVCSRLAELGKKDADVYKMIKPQLDQMVDNCMLVRNCSSSKSKAAQDTMKTMKAKIPIVPEKLRQTMSDDVNLANLSAKKKQTKKKKKKKTPTIPQTEVAAPSSTPGGCKRKAAASPVNESATKRKAIKAPVTADSAVIPQVQVAVTADPAVIPQVQVAAPTIATDCPKVGRKRKAAVGAPPEVAVVAPAEQVAGNAPPDAYADAELVTNKSVVWLYKLCDQLRESTNTDTTALELSQPAIIVLDDIRSDTETQFTNLTYARMLRKEYKKKEVTVSSQFITTLANKCDALIKSEEEVTGAEMRKLFAHISLKK